MRITKTHTLLLLASLLGLSLNACDSTKKESKPASDSETKKELEVTAETTPAMSTEDKELWTQAAALFKPLPGKPESPEANPTTAEKIALGKMLYHDPRLSKSGSISCNSCHNLASFGVDNRSTSIGHGFQTGARNSPTVLNADYQLAQFWDGRAADLEAQAEGPVLNPIEMAMPDEAAVLKRLGSIPEYQEAFKKAFSENEPALSYKNTARAIAAFERTLITPSRFDSYLGGDASALNTDEKAGLKQFMTQGCTACHSGMNVGGSLYQKFGVVSPYEHQQDMGRFDISKEEKDKYFFKVPTLRNIAKTYPYFHDGKVWDLGEAVKTMGKSQLGKDLTDQEIKEIVTFLNALTGELPMEARTLPTLPASQADTPKPVI